MDARSGARIGRRTALGLVLGGAIVGLRPPRAAAQNVSLAGDRIPVLFGRWNVAFHVAGGSADTVWVVEPSANGTTSIATVGPNQVALSILEARLADDVLHLAGNTNLGPATLTAPFDPQRLVGRFRAGEMNGDFVAEKRPDARSRAVVELFDQAAATFQDNLFSPVPLNDAWQAVKAERRASLAVDGATERDMVVAVRTLMAATGVSHLGYLIEPSGPTVTAAEAGMPAVSWRRLRGDLGYIRIASFVEAAIERDRLDTAFAELADTRGLVVDLQGNSGGNLGLAMRLGDHLFEGATAAGSFATRRALDTAGVSAMDELPTSAFSRFEAYGVDEFQAALDTGAVTLITGGRAANYPGPVAVLIDGSSASTTEGMAAVIKESGRARLFGLRTAGQMLSSRRFETWDGYTMRLAYADFRTPGGVVVEGFGVAPGHETRPGGENALNAATAWLRRGGRA